MAAPKLPTRAAWSPWTATADCAGFSDGCRKSETMSDRIRIERPQLGPIDFDESDVDADLREIADFDEREDPAAGRFDRLGPTEIRSHLVGQLDYPWRRQRATTWRRPPSCICGA